MIKHESPLVSVEWLYKHLDHPQLVILDASIPKVTHASETIDHLKIPKTRFFDIKMVFSDQDASYPNTMLSPENFEKQAQNLGINNEDFLVVYDQYGIYSSARAWWMFKAMGHNNVAVLDGGLPNWKSHKYPLAFINKDKRTKGNFKAAYNKTAFKSFLEVQISIENKQTLIDARSSDRFSGLVDEPRKGLRSGHIPSSTNIPYTNLMRDGIMLELNALEEIFKDIKQPIFTCGSGVTACVLALGFELAGGHNASVYDGSWTEWGSMHELPIEK